LAEQLSACPEGQQTLVLLMTILLLLGREFITCQPDTHRPLLLDDQKEGYSFECGRPRAFTAALAAQCYCGAAFGALQPLLHSVTVGQHLGPCSPCCTVLLWGSIWGPAALAGQCYCGAAFGALQPLLHSVTVGPVC